GFGITNAISCDVFRDLNFRSRFEAYSAELQQIIQATRHTLIFGGRYQDGETRTGTQETRAAGKFPPYGGGFGEFVSAQENPTDLTRLSVYAYDDWHLFDPLWLSAGLDYDRLDYPRNVDLPPVSNRQT